MSKLDDQCLRRGLLAPVPEALQVVSWCHESAQWALPLQHCLRNGLLQFAFASSDLDLSQAAKPWTPYCWTQTYKRQTACPSDFAWLDLVALPWSSEGLLLEIAFVQVLPEWGGNGLPLAEDREALLLLPAVLKGLVEGVRAHSLQGVHIKIAGMRVHPVDSRPTSFFRCAFQALDHLHSQMA